MAATLLGAGLAPQSALIVTQLPQPSTDHAAVSSAEFHTVQVPILPTSPTAELLQPGQQQEGGSSGGAAAVAAPTNVPTVAVPAARQYPVLRMLCWHLAGLTINQEHADGAAHAHVIADVQQVMHEVWSLCNRLQDEQVFFSWGDLREVDTVATLYTHLSQSKFIPGRVTSIPSDPNNAAAGNRVPRLPLLPNTGGKDPVCPCVLGHDLLIIAVCAGRSWRMAATRLLASSAAGSGAAGRGPHSGLQDR